MSSAWKKDRQHKKKKGRIENMKYVYNEVLKDRKGEIQLFQDEDGKERELRFGDAAKFILEAYMPNQNLQLTPAETRSIFYTDKVLSKLESDALENGGETGHFAFEDKDFEAMKKAVMALAPMMMMTAKMVPFIEDIFNNATSEDPA